MFSPCKYVFLCVIPVLYFSQSCTSEPVLPPILMLYSPGDPEYTEVLVKREHDNLTLVCELRGDTTPRNYVWNYVSNGTLEDRPYTVEPLGLASSSKLWKADLALSDSGEYMCSAPPFSVTKYILVQPKGVMQCARGAFACGARCVLAAYVCDGRADCARREDESRALCRRDVCAGSDKLNCSSGRCIPAAACCRGAALCRQPACCDEYPGRMQGFAEEFPLFEDRRAPDDYGFIQSTIYTVTACALIFMIAVVLLVSAVCKMHMKRAALRGYARPPPRAPAAQQTHRFPPCYEASRLLEESRLSPQHYPALTDTHHLQCEVSPPPQPRALGRLSSMFSSRYRQVPTQPEPVELQTRPSSPLACSPTYCSLALGGLDEASGRDLACLAPHDLYQRRSARRNTLERVMDQLDRQRLTLPLGRFQLSLPRLARLQPRPDTPDVAELDLDDLDFVRLNSSDTYTLNGRTIRLLGANFENYPAEDGAQPPPYPEAARYKLYGPPPQYLSREGLHPRDQEAATNVEMPPCYDELNAPNELNDSTVNDLNDPTTVNDVNDPTTVNNNDDNGNVDVEENRLNVATNVIESQVETLSSIIDNLPAIDSDVNANEADSIDRSVINDNGNNVNANNNVVE